MGTTTTTTSTTTTTITTTTTTTTTTIRHQNLTASKTYLCLTGNGSSDKVGAEADIGGVSESGGGGGHRVDRVGCGESSKVVVLEELGLSLSLAVDNWVVVGERQSRHPQSSSIGGGGDNATSSVPSQNLSNSVGFRLCFPLAVNKRGGVAKSRDNSGVWEAGNLEPTMVSGGGDHTTIGSACQHLANSVGFGLSVNGSSQSDNDKSSHGDRLRFCTPH